MDTTPFVSVIIPVYNAEKYLRQCLDSVVSQTLREIEILCVDDGSTDGSPAILREYEAADRRVKVLTQKNQYAGTARNNGMAAARGKYLYFMDSDDCCLPRLLQSAVCRAEAAHADIVVFDYLTRNIHAKSAVYCTGVSDRRVTRRSAVFSYQTDPGRICTLVAPVPWNKLFLRSFVQEHDLTYLPLSTTNDITFSTMSVLQAHRIAYLPKALICYRTGHTGTVTSRKRENLDNVITAALMVDKLSSELTYYAQIRPSIREFVAENLRIGLERYAGEPGTPEYGAYAQKIERIFAEYPLFAGSASFRDGTQEQAALSGGEGEAIRKGLRCLRQKGLRHTWDHLLVHLKIKRL